jgi:hypothetical protein
MKAPTGRLLPALFATVFLLNACKHDHEIQKKDFTFRSKTWYRVSPTEPAPIEVNGVHYTSFSNFPGGGSGTASYIGNCAVYFNQLTYGSSPEAPPAGSVSAPVKDVPGYYITGGPLPLIQAGDFAGLAATISLLNIPQTIHSKIVNAVLFNEKGDAIFTSAITGSGSTFPVSETRVGFNGKALLVTGRGKFAHAIGEIDYSGYFNVTDPGDAEYNADGWINF